MTGAEPVLEAVRADGLLAPGQKVVVMLSGGRDSVCLLDVAAGLCEPRNVTALHVNYGLRAAAEADQRHCEQLCEELCVELSVVHAHRAPDQRGNLQAWARDLRYSLAIELARKSDPELALVASGHTATDQVETILYRLAASPGRRALLGMSKSEGRLVRPLLGVTREQTAGYCRARGLSWREDESNLDELFARVRVRHGLVQELRAVHPAAEANVLRTAELLREEAKLLDTLVEQELGGRSSISVQRLHELSPALARLIVIRLAEEAAGSFVPQAGGRVSEILELAARSTTAQLHVGGSVGAIVADGQLSMVRLPKRGEQRDRSSGTGAAGQEQRDRSSGTGAAGQEQRARSGEGLV
jgi:tRNA(Ile)-lysidine synthase